MSDKPTATHAAPANATGTSKPARRSRSAASRAAVVVEAGSAQSAVDTTDVLVAPAVAGAPAAEPAGTMAAAAKGGANGGPVMDFGASLLMDWWTYAIDTAQRSILYWDVLRQRGNEFLDHRRQGLPPVLDFTYELLMDGRELERPANYALLRILPRPGDSIDDAKRPYVVVDPRAGHGPGIGGTKQDSQIGVALSAGHPVYFITFYPEPVPGQTIMDVKAAKAVFLEEVARRHPNAHGKPVVVGNCQAGWSVMIVGAARPEVTGPIIVNGSPLAYWAGVKGRNPMRYRGGLIGGTWLASLSSDIGNGVFDGAHLVSNFETLNPANTLWTKQYNLYSKVDTEERRYLDFERWWGGFFLMTQQEMEFIVENLFVGNKLNQGGVTLEDGRPLDLRLIDSPLVVFASKGDNITPPEQALQWIADLYGSEDEIKRRGKVIVYLVHSDIGHLGIFVSGRVAQREHAEIVGVIEYLEMLPPGLYEMVIEAHELPDMDELDPTAGRHNVRFEERRVADILALDDDGQADAPMFERVDRVSEANADAYRRFVRPWVRATANDVTAEMSREMHPLRLQRTLISDLNPLMWPVRLMAEQVKRDRRIVPADNPFLAWERTMADMVEKSLNSYRDRRDEADERLFHKLYDDGGLLVSFAETLPHSRRAKADGSDLVPFPSLALPDVAEGGFAEGFIRAVSAMLIEGGQVDRREFIAFVNILRSTPRLSHLQMDELRRLFVTQSALLRQDLDAAIASLPTLLPTQEDRHEVMVAIHSVVMADFVLTPSEEHMLARLRAVLGEDRPALSAPPVAPADVLDGDAI